MSTEEIIKCSLLSCERVTINDTYMILLLKISIKNILNRSTNKNLCVCRLCYLTSCNSYLLTQVNLSFKEKTTKEDNSRRIYSPYYLSLVYWRNVVNLNTNISCRTWSVKNINLHIFCICKCRSTLLCTNTKINLGNLAQCRKTCLKSRFVTL